MLRRWRRGLHASISDDGARVRLLQLDQRGRRKLVCIRDVASDEPVAEVTNAIDALDQALREMTERGHDLAGLRCDVAVADAWMVYDVIESDLDQMSRRSADELVSAALADTAGLRPDEVVVRWQRQGANRNFACALPLGTMQALQGVLHRHRVRLGTVSGDLLLAFNTRRHGIVPQRSVLAVPRPGGTQLGLIVDGGFAALRFEPNVSDPESLLGCSRALMRCAGFEPDDATRYYADESLSENTETAWVRDVSTPHWRDRLGMSGAPAALDLDLSPTRARVRPASWMLLAAGALTLTIAAFQFQTASGQHLREARALQALEVSLNETRVGGSGKATPQDAGRVRATAAVVRELLVPWPKLFAALESVASHEVALLSVEPSALKQEVRIVAEAKSSGAMLDFLEALRAQSLRDVVLVSHQVQSQTAGAPIRFQARAVWDSQ